MNSNALIEVLRTAFPGRVTCTTREAIQATGIAHSTLHYHIKNGDVPSIVTSTGEHRQRRLIDLTEAGAV